MNFDADNIFNNDVVEDFTFSICRQPKLPKGVYKYIINEVLREDKVPTAYGVKDRIVIKYSINYNNKKVEIVEKMNISTNPQSRLIKFIKTICEAYQVQSINLKSLEGSEGYLELDHIIDDNGNVYERIISIDPINDITL